MRHRRGIGYCTMIMALLAAAPAWARPAAMSAQQWRNALDEQMLDYYQDPASFAGRAPVSPAPVLSHWSDAARQVVEAATSQSDDEPFPYQAGKLRARMQQGLVIEMARAIRDGRIDDAKRYRAQLDLPRGVSSAEGAMILQTLAKDYKRDDAVRVLVREAITWQTTRVRQLFAEALRALKQKDVPMPGRMMEWLGESLTLADLPDALRKEADIQIAPVQPIDAATIASIHHTDWAELTPRIQSLRDRVESHLPVLLSDKEKTRRQRMLLKLVELVPKEYGSGVRDHKITVALEYHEAVSFTQQARQMLGELAPLWMTGSSQQRADAVRQLEALLDQADQQITAVASKDDLQTTMDHAAGLLRDKLGISLHRGGTTADIVDEVMLETRKLLGESLAAAMQGRWSDAAQLRLEAYTTYDPELEARLLPRDPELAKRIEALLLDGVDKPGVKSLLDRHAPPEQLQPAYERVYKALDQATALLKSGISPTAAAASAFSIVTREGLEGLLVIVAILAGLRGPENKRRRQLIWLGIAASFIATGGTWMLSRTIITSLHNYGELIEAITGILAIGILLLITNWLFHQIYWRQWVTTLKSQAIEGESAWQLLTVGFLIGYREGFETVLFLQSLVMDAGGKSITIGVTIGCVVLIGLAIAALRLGLKLPYFKILLVTAAMIGLVLISFVGSTARVMQTIGWLPVHRLTDSSWPAWFGTWFGIHNTCESIALQGLAVALVLTTWRVARWQAKRKANKRRATAIAAATSPTSHTSVHTERSSASPVVARGR